MSLWITLLNYDVIHHYLLASVPGTEIRLQSTPLIYRGRKGLEKVEKDVVASSKAQRALIVVWPLISTRTSRIVLLSGVVAIGIFFNWNWFVAAGVAPIILSTLPCAVMCALGLCMRPCKKGSCIKNGK